MQNPLTNLRRIGFQCFFLLLQCLQLSLKAVNEARVLPVVHSQLLMGLLHFLQCLLCLLSLFNCLF